MSQPKTQQPLFWLNLGAAFEYYDFSVYALLAATIGQRFFANFSNPTISAFFLFVIGYLARPLGGWLFAKFGDLYGRRPSIIASSTILAAATLLLAATPTANQTLAVVWLTSCRLIQGLCWGAEVPSVSTLIFEANIKRYKRCALLITSIAIGALAGGVIITALQHSLSTQQMQHGGWRIAFAGGAVLAIISAMLRSKLQESQEFIKSKFAPEKIGKKILSGISYQLPISCLIFLVLALASIIPNPPLNMSLLITLAIGWSCICLPIAGALYDNNKHNLLFYISVIGLIFAIISWAIYNIEPTHKSAAIWLSMALLAMETTIACLSPRALIIVARSFKTRTRLTGFSLAYNMSYLLASLLPLILLHKTHDLKFITVVLIIITALVIWRYQPKNNHR